jgi:arsenate reductase
MSSMPASSPTGVATSPVPSVVSSVVPPELLSVCRDLAARYRGIFSPETVLRTVYESYQLFITTSGASAGQAASHIPQSAAAHAYRFAADWLADAASGRAAVGAVSPTSRPPRVLFVCLHDTGRAQMAAALLRRRAGGCVAVRAAGPVAGRVVQPVVVAAMAEFGIGISEEYPQPLLDDVVRAADVVITMGCGDICPVYLGKRYLDWPLSGTAGHAVAAVRAVRDQIDAHVVRLLDEMTRDGVNWRDGETINLIAPSSHQFEMAIAPSVN